MPTKFFPAPEVEEIARPLIRDFHTHLISHGCHIEYVFRDDIPKSKGQAVWGTSRKASGLAAFLANQYRFEEDGESDEENEPFFIITISEPIWETLKEPQRIALVDHELMHCWAEEGSDGSSKLSIVGHDFEGFNAEIRRHGLWRPNAVLLSNAMKEHKPQLPLESKPSPPPKPKPSRRTITIQPVTGGVAH